MPRANLSLLLAYLLVLSTLEVVHALPSLPPAFSSSVLPQRRADPDPQLCGFDGDSNTYGLGIRLGLYMQWLSTALCHFLGSSKNNEIKNMKGINLCFQASVFGGLLYITFTDGRTQGSGQLYAAEVWIMLSLCTGGFSGDPMDYIKRTYLAHNICSSVLDMAWASYGVWFIFTGMDQMAHPPCSRFMFFYSKVDMYHWFRVFSKVGIIPLIIFKTIVLIGLVLVLCVRDVRDLLIDDRKVDLEAKVPFIFVVIPLGLLFSVVLSTELVIRWNHVHNVNSIGETGQLLPLIVACLTFARVLYKLFVDIILPKYVKVDSNRTIPEPEVDQDNIGSASPPPKM